MNKPAKEVEMETPEEISVRDDTTIEDDLNEVINRLEGDIGEDDGLQDEGQVEEQASEEQQEEVAAQPDEPQEEEASTDEPQRSKYSAPVGWSNEAKSEFDKLPETVQAQVHSREVEIARTMEQTAQQRRIADQFRNVVEPFRPLMAAEGVQDPLVAVQGLMNTTAQLAMGAPEQKASKIAELVKHYKIDIELLDRALSGDNIGPPPLSPYEQQMAQRLQGIEQRFQQQEQMRQQAMIGQAQSQMQQFASDPQHEFFEEVRPIMADFMDVATRNGQTMTMEEAYQRACYAHPEVSKRIAQRNAASGSTNMMGKKRAASSVKGSHATAPEPETMENMDLRDILEKQVPGSDSRI